jgi:oligopeptide transport system substrate-binding protein
VSRVRRVTAFVAAVAVLLTGGCGLFGGGSAEPDTVTIGIAEPTRLLPSSVSDPDGSQILAALFTPLVGYDEKRQPVPRAADSVTSTDGNRTWKVTLAAGYTFHDGEPVTADSYLAAWNYAAAGNNKQRNAFMFDRIEGFADVQGTKPKAESLSGLKRVDDRTFEIVLTAPFAEFAAMLGHPAFLPLPKSAFAQPGAVREGFENAPIGQGPYRMTGSWERGKAVRVERYEQYPRPPEVAKIEFKIYDSTAAAYADLRAGSLDVDLSIPETEFADARADLGDRFQLTPSATVHFLAVPDFEPDYADPRVRQAISMAIDREALIKAYFSGSQLPARSFVPPTVPGYRVDSCGSVCAFDPAAARKAYQAAAGPATLQISFNSDGGHEPWVTGLCQQLATHLGITCKPVPRPRFDALLADVRELEPVGMFRMTWSMDYPSMESYLAPLFSTSGSSNYAGYRNTTFDTLLRQAGTAANAEAAVPLYQQAEDMLVTDLPVIPLRSSQRAVGHSERVGGVTLDAYERVDVAQLTIAP